jgi:hypothetical protein
MDQDSVHDLEALLEAGLRSVLQGRSAQPLPWKVDQRTLHLMAKAAGAVYEAACDAVQRRPAGPPRRRTAAKKRPSQSPPGGR